MVCVSCDRETVALLALFGLVILAKWRTASQLAEAVRQGTTHGINLKLSITASVCVCAVCVCVSRTGFCLCESRDLQMYFINTEYNYDLSICSHQVSAAGEQNKKQKA